MALRHAFAPHRHAQERNPPCRPFNPHPSQFFRRYKIAMCRVNFKFRHNGRAFSVQHEDLRPSNAPLAQLVAMKPLPLTLHDDPHLLVVLKPAGLAVHGKGESLMDFIQASSQGLGQWLQPVHRLDHGTRGPVVVAKSAAVLRRFQAIWPDVEKTYHSWVEGPMQTPRGSITIALEGKACRTEFNTLGHRSWAVHGHATLVEWQLRTGRTHQIRRHAAAIGHPIVGDQVYGSFPRYTGHGLHLTCTRLAFRHPITNEAVDIVTPPAKKMKRAVPGNFQCEGMPTSPWLKLFSPD